jgi:hypothetical protein
MIPNPKLKVRAGGYTKKGEAIVQFYRRGTSFYDCLVWPPAARSDRYLRDLVQFMQHRVPHPR